MARRNIPTLDGWRGIAVLLVLAAHFGDQTHPSVSFFTPGRLGVNIFFAISGYLIFHLLLEEENANGKINLAAFYVRRAFRILPPLLCYLTVISAARIAGLLVHVEKREVAASLFFFRNYQMTMQRRAFYTGHFWSLAIEEHFYLIFPVLLIFLGRKRLGRLLVITAVLVAIWRAMAPGLVGATIVDLAFHTDFQIDALLVPACLAIVLSDPGRRAAFTRWTSSIAWLLVTVIAIKPPSPQHSVQALALALTVTVTSVHPTWIVSRVLEVGVLRWVGRMSYSLYIWQQLFLPRPFFQLSHGALLQRFPLNLVLIFGCAAFSYYVIERPCLRIGHAISQRIVRRAHCDLSPVEASAPAR
jgi:peptidoglycan/LPS O-acetylase OafA/YrhL